jgi:hypothetical protein
MSSIFKSSASKSRPANLPETNRVFAHACHRSGKKPRKPSWHSLLGLECGKCFAVASRCHCLPSTVIIFCIIQGECETGRKVARMRVSFQSSNVKHRRIAGTAYAHLSYKLRHHIIGCKLSGPVSMVTEQEGGIIDGWLLLSLSA